MASFEAPPIMEARIEREIPLIHSDADTVDIVGNIVVVPTSFFPNKLFVVCSFACVMWLFLRALYNKPFWLTCEFCHTHNKYVNITLPARF